MVQNVPGHLTWGRMLKIKNARDTLRGWLLITAAFFLAGARLSFSAEGERSALRMHFKTNDVGETLVLYGEKYFSLTNVPKALNVTQASANLGAQFSMIPEDAIVAVTSEQFPGFSVELPPKQSASFGMEYARKIFDLQTSDLNLQAIYLSFPDGAKVEMQGQADGRFELMDDGTYAFFGAGRMTGVNADGTAVRFGYVFPPLFGGKLIAPPTNNPNARFTRLSPVTPLVFIGNFETALSARVGEQTVTLEPGRAETLRAPNGAEVSLMLNPATQTVDWQVGRGVFRISVDNIQCWRALGTSGQSASMQWDRDGVLIQIVNKGGKYTFQHTMLVNLNPVLNVAVGELGTFQYGRTSDCSTFIASAHGAETTMYNAETGRFVRLDEGNMNVISGSPETDPKAPQRPKTPIQLSWRTDTQVELKSPNDLFVIGLDGHEIFQVDTNTQLDVHYFAQDRVRIHVNSGAIAVTPDFMPHVTIEILEGSGVTFGYDRGSDIFRVEPSANNLSPVAIRTPNGFYPRIGPGERITFVINRSTFTGDGGTAGLIFAETAGSAASRIGGGLSPIRSLPTGRGNPPFLSAEPRIDEPPVTTFE